MEVNVNRQKYALFSYFCIKFLFIIKTMLQRFQTLLLLLVLIFLVLLLFLPLMYLPQEIRIFCYEMRPLLTLNLVSIVAVIVTLSLFKRRMIQIRISIFNTVILLGLQGLIAYFFFIDRMAGAAFSITAVFPLCAAIITILAIRYIGRDEAMVRSLNRLRK